jgi:hypothetical protein
MIDSVFCSQPVRAFAQSIASLLYAKEIRYLVVKIDQVTGEFVIGEQIFGPSLKEDEFLTSELGVASKEVRRSDCRIYYEVWKQISPKLEIGITLGFSSGGPLQRISAQFVKPGLRGSAWSKAAEDEIKCFHDKWLKEQLGPPPYQFQWGRVMSIMEPHWYSANIIIDYTRGS